MKFTLAVVAPGVLLLLVGIGDILVHPKGTQLSLAAGFGVLYLLFTIRVLTKYWRSRIVWRARTDARLAARHRGA